MHPIRNWGPAEQGQVWSMRGGSAGSPGRMLTTMIEECVGAAINCATTVQLTAD